MRTNECLRAGWRFAPAGALLETHADKGDACPLEARLDFDDSSWRAISVPHDFVIEETPQPQEDRLRGYLRHGQGWYRLRFSLPREDEGRRLTLLFEGVASRCAVWLNGFRLCVHEGQFCSFEVDISQAAEYGGENLLCLWADASYQEGWWYGGAEFTARCGCAKRRPFAWIYGAFASERSIWAASAGERRCRPIW